MKKQQSAVSSQKEMGHGSWSYSLFITVHCLLFTVLVGCSGLKDARDIKNAPMPLKYVETKDKEAYSTE
ncbi:MAG: hypothetical protein HY099_04280, partial [Nitrospirae bacterium]|nr:hypothetical protein [Nitrospirota bacterium]